MTKTPSISETKDWINELFEGVKDLSGDLYVNHCFRVENNLPDGLSEDVHHAALLHDAMEDCGVTQDNLRDRGYTERAIWLVKQLTHIKVDGKTYMDYIKEIADLKDSDLIHIKLADNKDNSDPARHKNFTKGDSVRRLKKYSKARKILEEVLVVK